MPILPGFSAPLIITAITVLILVLWKVPQWQVRRVQRLSSKERFDLVNEARKTLATILGGVLLLLGFFGTWQNIKIAQEGAATSQKALQVSQEGQITDRFTKAIEQLGATDVNGKPKLELRLGGIYALERIANDSERDHWPIMEVLCTYVREIGLKKATLKEEQKTLVTSHSTEAEMPGPTVRADVQAVLTVIGRRNVTYESAGEHVDLSNSDLGGADLSDAHLRWADLDEAILFKAKFASANLDEATFKGALLERASLYLASLVGADFNQADLRGADLAYADLRDSNLTWAVLVDADFSGADLRHADLSNAHFLHAFLYHADLRGANLSGATDLTQQQIDQCRGDTNTTLPTGLQVPPQWKGY